jgi:hypothetical protein
VSEGCWRDGKELVQVERFDALLSAKMYDVMKGTFGESASTLIYCLMERQTSLKREEVGEKIDAFHAYLNRLVGSEVSQIILTTGLKALCRELQREYEEVEKYFSVLDELYEVKFKLLVPSLKEERSVCN